MIGFGLRQTLLPSTWPKDLLERLRPMLKIYQAGPSPSFFLTRCFGTCISSWERKKFYYECAGRCTEKPPSDGRLLRLWYACFHLSGQVLESQPTDKYLHCYIQISETITKYWKKWNVATKETFSRKPRIGQVTSRARRIAKKKDTNKRTRLRPAFFSSQEPNTSLNQFFCIMVQRLLPTLTIEIEKSQ